MQYLKQSTAATLKIGPFLDDADGKTAETGLTIAQADVRLSKNGGDIAQKNESSSCTHDELGIYGCPIDATDTGTLGRLQLWVHASGALPVYHEFMVVTAEAYDTLCGSNHFTVDLADDAITSAKFDETTAFPLKSDDSGSTQVARTGADSDTLEILSDEIAALNNLSAAQVNAEVVDALITDTYGEPGQGAPPATASLKDKICYLFKAWRNKLTTTSGASGQISLYNDVGDTIDQKSVTSDDDTTFTKGEYISGA